MNILKTALSTLLLCASFSTQASLTYSTWTSNDAVSANYIFTVEHTGNRFNYRLTVDPWNAEAFGLFIDLGNVTIQNVDLNQVVPTGNVSIYGVDTNQLEQCGSGGCTLQGLGLPAIGGGDWELVLRLGSGAFNGIQTFSWSTSDFGLNESAFGVVAIRAKQMCSGNQVLTPTSDAGCEGSDKSYGYAAVPENDAPEPGTLGLLALSLLGMWRALQRR